MTKYSSLVQTIGFLLITYIPIAFAEPTTPETGKAEWIGKYDKKMRKRGLWIYYSNTSKPLIKAHYSEDELHGKYLSFYKNGKIKQKSNYRTNLLHGKHEILYNNKNNSPAIRGSYIKGAKTGQWSRWTVNFELVETEKYSNGLKNGIYTSFVNSHKYQELNYRKGLLNGLARTFSIDTKKIIQQGQYKKNKKEGLWTTWTSDGGRISKTTTYHDGLLNGKLIEYTEGGQTWKIWPYKNNILQGHYTEYFAGNKKIMYLSGHYKNDMRIGLWKYYYKNTKLWKNIRYQHDKKHGRKSEYFESGRIWKNSEYINDKLQGKYVQYIDRYGSPRLLTGQYLDNMRHSKWTHWYPNHNKTYSTSQYKKGHLSGEVRKYYPSGRLWSKTNYNDNFLHGAYVQYYDNTRSSIKTRGYYKNDYASGTWISRNYKGKTLKRKTYPDTDTKTK